MLARGIDLSPRGTLALSLPMGEVEIAKCMNVRFWLCVTSIAGPNGGAQLYER